MNFMNRHRKIESPLLKEQSFVFNYHEQIGFLFDTVEFMLSKLGQLWRWQNQQQGLKRRKSTVKYFSKDIDSLPNFRVEAIQMPIFDQFPKIINRLQLFKTSIPEKDPFDSKTMVSFKQHMSSQFESVIQRIEDIQTRTKSIENDLMELISLYKDLL